MRRAVLATAAALLLAGCGDGYRSPDAQATAAAPAPPPPPAVPAVIPGEGEPVAHVTRATWLLAEPEGQRLARLPVRTQFKSERVLAVVARRGPWVGVLAPELRNGRVGWLDARQHTRLFRVPYRIEADLSQRRVIVRRLGRVVRTLPVAIGRPAAPTPPGRYAVTDKLRMGGGGGPYGCCALALTGHQPRLPQGWGGGDRLALHATPAEETIGSATSAGCLRTTNAVMRRLLVQIPLGTPFVIRR